MLRTVAASGARAGRRTAGAGAVGAAAAAARHVGARAAAPSLLPARRRAVPASVLSSSTKKHAPAHPPPPPETPLTETIRDFLDPEDFYSVLRENRIDSYFGVPDSLLKDFAGYLADNVPAERHVITANEGSAVAMASGYHMATKRFPVVYMQNSGIGNAINPFLSLTDARVYSIPMLVMVGWRGEPGKRDEPQHIVQGKVMTSLLSDLGIQFEVLPDYLEGAEEAIESAIHHMETRGSPYVFLVKRQCFRPYKQKNLETNNYEMKREQALTSILGALGDWDVCVATTGFPAREVYEIRERAKQGHKRDFLTVGSMGHATAIAAGIAIGKPSRQVFCLDGDGAALMHLGNMATCGIRGMSNFKHVLLNNGAHDSVGGQPTGAFGVDFLAIAKAVGYKHAELVDTEADLPAAMERLRAAKGPALLEVRVNRGARSDLGRPKESPKANKEEFIRFLDG